MAYKLGDIIFFDTSPNPIGHVGIMIDGTWYYHANKNGFEKSALDKQTIKAVFRAPEGTLTQERASQLSEVMDAISGAGYRKNFANALIGSSKPGPAMWERIGKYWEKLQKKESPVVNAVTCAEAAILCYQLTFFCYAPTPLVIDLDAKHSMPGTLEKWLAANSWVAVGAG